MKPETVDPQGATRPKGVLQAIDPRMTLLALASALLISGCGFFVDSAFHGRQRVMASDLYTCIIAFVLCYLLLRHEARRRAVLTRKMEVAAEVNHHIRNALTGVIYTAAIQNDHALQSVLEDATARIDWVLTTVLPDGADDLKWPVQVASWRPSSWRHQNQPRP